MQQRPILPDYSGACVTNILPALDAGAEGRYEWFPSEVAESPQCVLLVLDGLGWLQLQERGDIAPVMSSMSAQPLTTVAPSTTAAALTSIVTGLPPSEHGVVGYEMVIGDEFLNSLSWRTPSGDARQSIRPDQVQPYPGFLGKSPPVLTKREFRRTGFTDAHLRDGRFDGWVAASSLVAGILGHVKAGEPFVYAYYDGIDKVSHADGLETAFDLEIGFVDQMVLTLLDRLPQNTTLLVTADHGQVHVGDGVKAIDSSILAEITAFSGEGRFRWLHSDHPESLLEICEDLYGHEAWVCRREQILDERWLGPAMSAEVASRLGDVAIIARDLVAYEHPSRPRSFDLIGRHGGLTEAEMLVPLLHSLGRG